MQAHRIWSPSVTFDTHCTDNIKEQVYLMSVAPAWVEGLQLCSIMCKGARGTPDTAPLLMEGAHACFDDGWVRALLFFRAAG